MAEQFSPLVTFENSPVFVTAGHPGHALDGRRARQIADALPACGMEGAVIKLGELVMTLNLHRQGLSVSAIARQIGVDRKTVRTHIAKGLEPPAYKKRPPKKGLVGTPRTILFDRMKTAVIGEDEDGLVVYNRALVDLARHYGFQPRACWPYRAKTKGKVERPFRYIPRGLLSRRRLSQSPGSQRPAPPLARHGRQPTRARNDPEGRQ